MRRVPMIPDLRNLLTCNRHFASLAELEAALTQALRPFWKTPARALSLVHHWRHSQATATP